MTCPSCRVRKAVAGAGLCLLCLGGMDAASPVQHPHPVTANALITVPAQPGHAEQPHPPEADGTEPGSASATEIGERHALVLDHPRYGVLDGRNYLGYCSTCPSASQGTRCYGPCPS